MDLVGFKEKKDRRTHGAGRRTSRKESMKQLERRNKNLNNICKRPEVRHSRRPYRSIAGFSKLKGKWEVEVVKHRLTRDCIVKSARVSRDQEGT